MEKREKNLDLLRVICTVMVIILHVAALYGKEIHLTNEYELYPKYYFTVGNFYHSITRTAVPIFVMLSGAFLLDNPKNIQYIRFYKKTFKNIILPTLIFSILYVLYSLCIEMVTPIIIGDSPNYLKPFKDWWMEGAPYYHMWYMYMIIGCYAVTPIALKIKNKIGLSRFEILAWILMIMGIIVELTCKLIWPLEFIKYLGYFFLGNTLKNRNAKKTINFRLPLFFSILTLFTLVILQELKLRNGVLPNIDILVPLSPLVIVASLLMYVSFLNMKDINVDCSRLAYNSFNIYLFHAGILSVIDKFVNKILGLYFNPLWYIPMLTIIILYLSYICSIVFNKVMSCTLFKKSNIRQIDVSR